MKEKDLKDIFNRTRGHCHFCGDKVDFDNFGNKDEDGGWEKDHVIQKGKRVRNSKKVILPACYKCNRLRSNRTGRDLREIILLGIVAKTQVKKNNALGKELIKLKNKRLLKNTTRRNKNQKV